MDGQTNDSPETMRIYEAASGNYVQELKQALDEKFEEIPTDDLELALLRAAWHGHIQCVELLLERGVDVMALDGQENTPLILAAAEGHSDVVRAVLKYGSRVDNVNNVGYDALMKACENGHLTVAQILVENGANDENKVDKVNHKLNGKDEFHRNLHLATNVSSHSTGRQMTPLLITVYKGHVCEKDLVRLLLQRKSAVFDVDSEQTTALHTAAKLCGTDIVEMLINAGADVNAKDFYGETPLMKAASFNRLDITELLLKHGADVHIKDHMMRSALSISARNDGAAVIELLLKAGANIDQLDAHQNSPLFISINHRNLAAAKSLVKNGCDVTLFGRHMTTRRVMTNFQLAVWFKNTQMIEILYGAGAFTNQDLWDMFHDGVYSNHCEDTPAVWEYLAWLVRKPRPLISYCRLAILKSCRRPVMDSVDKLNIPAAMKEYLKFSDIVL